MKFTTLRTYIKFLSRHKVYTFVSVVGFAISLTFVLILSIFAGTQLSMDSFHKNKDRIYLLANDDEAWNANPVGDYVEGLLPEVETYTRIATGMRSIGATREEMREGRVIYADPDFFRIFTFPLLAGEPLQAIRTADQVVISKSRALGTFGTEQVVSRTIVVEDRDMIISGVMEDFPYNTHFDPADIVANYSLTTEYWGENVLESWNNCEFSIYFLAREGADLPSKAGLLREKFTGDYWPYRDGFRENVRFIPVGDIYFSDLRFANHHVKKGSFSTTMVYIGVALIILIISLLNYVNMTVAQAGFRGKEAAIKQLVGSGRGRIVRQMLAESLVMTLFAFSIAVALALLVEPYFSRMLGVNLHLARHLTGGYAPVVVGGVLLLSFLAGIIPALVVSSFRPVEVVKGTFKRKVKGGYSKVLIVFQFTVCTVLLICTFLMREQAGFMVARDVGFNKENILVMSNVVGNVGELSGLRERLLQVPGVEAVGYSAGNPLDGGGNNSIHVDGQPVSMQVLYGDEEYVNIFGLDIEPTMASGIGESDFVFYLNRTGYNALQVDQTTSRVFHDGWGGIVAGVFRDIHIGSLHSAPGPAMFIFMKEDSRPFDIVVRLASDNIGRTIESVKEAYGDFTGGATFGYYLSDDRVRSWYDSERKISGTMGTFTVLSIIIMVMGVFAMSLYMIRQKEKEIGVRKVSGATVGQVLAMLNRQSLSRVAVAFIIACPVAWYGISQWLRNFIYRIEPGIGAFLMAGLIVAMLCMLSVSWQSWRAARANPVDSLKGE